MMNLPLLYWAAEETNDPRFSQLARAHADTAIRAFVRGNGSVHHIVRFDADTGEIVGSLGGQGKENGSVAYHDEKHNFPIVYGDYFFTEAVLKLCGKELFMW